MGKQFLIAAGMADTRKPCSAVWGIVICAFKAGPPESLQTHKIFFVSVILFYFCASEVLRNPGWIFHFWLTLSVSIFFLCFSLCLCKDVTMMKLLMDSWVTPTQWWWIAALSAARSSCLCSSVCWIDRAHKSLLEGEVLWELWPHLWCADVT